MFIISAAIFFILAPSIILYTFGFRYDLPNKKIIQMGIIYIIPRPQDEIKVSIDNAEEKNRLYIKGLLEKNYIVYNLLPKTYNVKVSKKDYWEWEKNLVVLPGTITYASPLLFPRNPEKNLIFEDSNIIRWAISPNFSKIAYLKNQDQSPVLAVYNAYDKSTDYRQLNDAGGKISEKITGANSSISWNETSDKIAVVLKTNPSQIIILNSGIDGKLLKIQINGAVSSSAWSDQDNSFFYLTSAKELYRRNLENPKNTPLKIAENVLAFAVKNNAAYYLDEKNLLLYKISDYALLEKKQLSYQSIAKNEQDMPPKPDNAGAKIAISSKNDIAVILPDKRLFLVKQNGIPIYLENGIESAEFSGNGDLLLFNSLNEVFTYDVSADTTDKNSENLITRITQKINGAEWHYDYRHIWFSAGSTLKNIETDSRPIPNTIDYLSDLKNSANFVYDNGAKYIYYDQSDEAKTSIYRVKME